MNRANPRRWLPRHRRLATLLAIVLGALTVGSVLAWQLRGSLVYFQTPSQALAAGMVPIMGGGGGGANHSVSYRKQRLGGMVKDGSIQQDADQPVTRFMVMDDQAELPVRYRGVLPDLFRAGQGVIAEGRFDDQGVFQASQLLTKHSEYYTPPGMPSPNAPPPAQ
jgi:cytochrome c-type biogenesis protein CcmE